MYSQGKGLSESDLGTVKGLNRGVIEIESRYFIYCNEIIENCDLNIYGCVVVCTMKEMTLDRFSDWCSGYACKRYTKRTKTCA